MMKEIHSKFVVAVRKGKSPEEAAVALGVPAEKGPKWMQKSSIKAAIEAPEYVPEAPRPKARTPKQKARKRAAPRRTARKK